MTQIKIKLGGNSLAKWDFTNPVIAPENVVLAFNSDLYKMDNLTLMVTIRNKYLDVIKQYKADASSNHTIDITDMVNEGELEVEISSYVKENGIATKTWRIPNIVCKKVGYEFEVIPELHELRRAIKELKTILEKNNLII